MPIREEPFINNHIYHVFNKTIESKKIFGESDLCRHFIDLIKYYRSKKANISYSKLNNFEEPIKQKVLKASLQKKYFQIEIIAYCLMPTHFHFLLKQRFDDGVRKFISNILNSFTKHINIKKGRSGPIFLPRFKSVRIKNDEQLIHVSRYIHLNPYSSGMVEGVDKLFNYHWSSFEEFIKPKNLYTKICNDKIILGYFKSKKDYLDFIFNNADYQKNLDYIKYTKKWS